MKTLIKKDRVTHTEFGNGTVVSVLKGGAMIEVDFKGTLRTCRVSELERVKSNSYTPKNETITIESLKEKISMVKGEYCNGNSSHAEGGRIALEQLEKMISNK